MMIVYYSLSTGTKSSLFNDASTSVEIRWWTNTGTVTLRFGKKQVVMQVARMLCILDNLDLLKYVKASSIYSKHEPDLRLAIFPR